MLHLQPHLFIVSNEDIALGDHYIIPVDRPLDLITVYQCTDERELKLVKRIGKKIILKYKQNE